MIHRGSRLIISLALAGVVTAGLTPMTGQARQTALAGNAHRTSPLPTPLPPPP